MMFAPPFFHMALCIQFILSFTPLASYTCCSLAFCALHVALPEDPARLPVLLNNAIALQLAFYAYGLLANPAFYADMRAHNKWNMTTFLLGDFFLHTLPSLAFFTHYRLNPRLYGDAMRANPTFGIQSLALNLIWAVLNNPLAPNPFLVDRQYVPATPLQWAHGWYGIVASHTMVSFCFMSTVLQ